MKKKILVTVIVLAVLVLAVVLYFAVIHPIVCKFYIPVDIRTGLDVYQQGLYLQHEDGQSFQDYFSALDFWQDGKVVDFYYGDNRAHDNPIYGKRCDILAIDIQLDEQTYQNVVSDIAARDTYSSYSHLYSYEKAHEWQPEEYVLWYPEILSKEKCGYLFAASQNNCAVRVIMITEVDDYTEGSDLVRILQARSLLLDYAPGDGWGRGDGSVLAGETTERLMPQSRKDALKEIAEGENESNKKVRCSGSALFAISTPPNPD